jgi:Xaa-Pro aminopeptidase
VIPTTLTHITSEAERERRYTAVRTEMFRNGYDALVICGRGDEFVRGRVQYVSDIFQWAGWGFVVLPLKGSPSYIGDPLWGLARAEAVGWITDLRLTSSPGDEVAAALSDHGLGSGRIGLVGAGDAGSWQHVDALHKAAPQASFEDATDLFEAIRGVKSDEELEGLRETSTILRNVFGALAAEIRPGVPERDVLAEAHRLCRQYGCLDGIALMGRPPFSLFGPGSDVPIQPDDVIVIDLEWGGPSGYWLELRRCFSFGAPPDDVRRFWDMRLETFAACVDVMRAGVSSIEIVLARNEVHRRYGYPPAEGLRYSAHGIGLDSLEPPWVPGKDRILEPGMVVSLHPDVVVPDAEMRARLGGVSIADNVLVTEGAAQRLTDTVVEWVTL